MASSVATNAPVALAATGLTKRYGERVALREVSFAAAPGELVAVIGPNGAGKTTLLSILAGIQRPDAGEVTRPPREIGWVPQQPAIYSKLTVAENLRLFARLEKVRRFGQTRFRACWSRRTSSSGPSDEVGTLSGGNQQRVNIAIGLLAEPPVLLLDEPSSSLDPRQRARLWEFVGGQAAHGTAVIFSTHDVQEAERYADRVLVLADGELLFAGTARELASTVAAGGSEAAGPRDFETAFVRFLHERGH